MCGSSLLTWVQISGCSQYPHIHSGSWEGTHTHKKHKHMQTHACTVTEYRQCQNTHLFTHMHTQREDGKHLFKLLIRTYRACHWISYYTCKQCAFSLSISTLSKCNRAAFPKASYRVTLSYTVSVHNQFHSIELKINTTVLHGNTVAQMRSLW